MFAALLAVRCFGAVCALGKRYQHFIFLILSLLLPGTIIYNPINAPMWVFS